MMRNLRIAITGNAGAGKSTVAGLLRKRGFLVLDADEIGHRLLERPGIIKRIEEELGPGLVREGRVDRKALGKRVFSDPVQLRKLNAIMKPRIAFELGKAMAENPEKPTAVDAALIYEYGIENMFDHVIVVVSDPGVMVARIAARLGYTEEEARGILASQMPQEEKARRASFVLDNRGSLKELESQLDAILKQMEVRD